MKANNRSISYLISLGVAAMLLSYSASISAETSTFSLSPTSGSAPLSVTWIDSVTLSDQSSAWTDARLTCYPLGSSFPIILLWDWDAAFLAADGKQNGGTENTWIQNAISQGNWTVRQSNNGYNPDGVTPWSEYKTVTVSAY